VKFPIAFRDREGQGAVEKKALQVAAFSP